MGSGTFDVALGLLTVWGRPCWCCVFAEGHLQLGIGNGRGARFVALVDLASSPGFVAGIAAGVDNGFVTDPILEFYRVCHRARRQLHRRVHHRFRRRVRGASRQRRPSDGCWAWAISRGSDPFDVALGLLIVWLGAGARTHNHAQHLPLCHAGKTQASRAYLCTLGRPTFFNKGRLHLP